jgi:hypothetical protein
MPKTLSPEVGGFLLFAIVLLVVGTIGGMRVATKAGYPAWVSLLFLVPVVDLVVLVVVAFSKWPVERRLEQVSRYRPAGQPRGPVAVSPAFTGQARQAASWSQPLGSRGSWDPIKRAL